MSDRMLAWLVVVSLQQPSPRAVIQHALTAVEGDSVATVARRWARAAQRDTTDRAALLGLGALARLTYAYDSADARLWRVINQRGDDAWADYARIEQGGALVVRGRLREGADAYSAALAAAMQRGDTVAVADALVGLAGPRSRLGGPADIMSFLERAETLAPGDSALVANARCQRALLLARAGQPGARALAEGGVALARAAGDRRQEARCHHAIAQSDAARGAIDSAAMEVGRAAELFRATRDRAALASAQQWRAYLYQTIGRTGEAFAAANEAVVEGERSGAMSVVSWANINLGMASLGLGDRLKANQHLTRAIALLEAQGDEWGLVTARSIMGGLARSNGDLTTAAAVYRESLAWAERVGQVQTQFNMHNALASIAIARKDWDDARGHQAASRAIARTSHMIGWERGLDYGDGVLALRRGDLATAERRFKAFLAVLDTLQHSTRFEARTMLAEVYARQGAVAAAEAEMTVASEDLDRWRASLTERDMRIRALEDAEYGNDPDLGVATVLAALVRAGRVEPALRFAERRRARELTDMVSRARSADPGTTRNGAAQLVVPPPTFAAADVITDDSTALLEYVTGRGGEPTIVFVVRRAGITARLLPAIDSLDSDARRFATLVEGGGDVTALARRLGRALLVPVVEQLDARVTRLIVIPDDVLARLPFDALVLADERYAIERFAVAVVPSAATLLALRARPGRDDATRLLAFGDPTFKPGADSANAATAAYRDAFGAAGGLGRLPSSAAEARHVARYAASAVVRLRGDASEAYLRTTPLDAFRVLHFATHALVDEHAVTRTALALAPGGGYDGFLGPAELAQLTLRADLVVLSACRTAGGELVGGEGVLGLTGPLLEAGARSIVATQWRIADTAAARVVDGLYRGLAGNQPVVDALRAAKLGALRAGAQPSEWAAFVAVGDPLARVPLTVPGNNGRAVWRWVLALGALLLAAALLYRWITVRRAGPDTA